MCVSDTKTHLLEATIACVERQGIQSVTSRDIAAEAGANVAAINYHFGGKGNLVAMAMDLSITNGMEHIAEIMTNDAVHIRERVRGLLAFLLGQGRAFPNLTRAHLYDAMVGGQPAGPLLIAVGAQLRRAVDATDPQVFPSGAVVFLVEVELAVQAVLMGTVAPQTLNLEVASDPETLVEALLRLVITT